MEPDKVFILEGNVFDLDYDGPIFIAASLDRNKLEKLKSECGDWVIDFPIMEDFFIDVDYADPDQYDQADINYKDAVEKHNTKAPVNNVDLHLINMFDIKDHELI